MPKTIVVIGNGIAALAAVEKIREQDQSSRLVVFSDENYCTYNRLELSKRIREVYPPEQIYVQSANWYQENKIELMLGVPVLGVDLENKQVILENDKVEYTHLLLANGGSNFVPPIPGIDLPNVFSLRSIKDAQNIQEQAKEGKRLLLIGGGLLALELAWQLAQGGLEITIVEMFPQLMPRQLDLESARYLEKVLEDAGIKLILEGQVAQLVGEQSLTGFQLKGEESIRTVDLCIYSTGMRSNIGVYRESGLAINHGVVVDHKMQTNIPQVYAAGDIAEYNGRVYGLWSAAKTQGAIAGENILAAGQEDGTRFEATNPVTNINVFNQVITSFGEVQPEGAVVFKAEEQGRLILKKLFFKDDVLCGAIFINNQKEVLLVKKAIERGLVIPLESRASFVDTLDFIREQA